MWYSYSCFKYSPWWGFCLLFRLVWGFLVRQLGRGIRSELNVSFPLCFYPLCSLTCDGSTTQQALNLVHRNRLIFLGVHVPLYQVQVENVQPLPLPTPEKTHSVSIRFFMGSFKRLHCYNVWVTMPASILSF